jgi:hypothetical protein
MFEIKYATSLVASSVGIDIQIILWELITKWRNEDVKLDHLQIYELSVEYAGGEVFQKVIHQQAEPSKTEIFYYKTVRHPIDATIWIVDSEEGAKMMFSSEYVMS